MRLLAAVLLIAGSGWSLPDLAAAPKLTLDELIGAGSFATQPPTTTRDFGIPPNPEAFGIRMPVKGIPLPVFDPNKKFDGPPLINDNNRRVIPIPANAFKITFDSKHPVHWNASEPIHVDLSKYISDKFECGFCLKIVGRLKEEISTKGPQLFTDDLKKTCEDAKSVGNAYTSCDMIDRVKVDRLASESAEALCVAEKKCKDHEEAVASEGRMEELIQQNKEEDEMRAKWKVEQERKRLIIEAEEAKWRREFKEAHPESVGIKPFNLNFPEVAAEGSGEDKWKPDFGGWDPAKETFAGLPVGDGSSGGAEDSTVSTDATVAGSSGAFTPKFSVQEKPPIDFVHEVLGDAVQKEDEVPSAVAAPEEGAAVEEEPSVVKAASPIESMVGAEGEKTEETPAVVPADAAAAAAADEETGPEPTSLFSTTTEATEHFTKGQTALDGEEQARRTLQEAILEAKKTVDEDIGFMSKPVVVPHREGASRVNLHEFSPHAEEAASESVAGGVESSSSTSGNVQKPMRAPIQCDPLRKQAQFSAHPAASAFSDAAPVESAAVAADEPAVRKIEIEEEQEGPANMAIPKARQMRVVNRVVQTAFQVDDIA